MAVQPAESNSKLILKWVICFVIAVLPLLIPVNDVYTVQMQRFLAITVLGIGILAFEMMNSFAVAIMMSAMWVLTGVCNYAMAFSSWTNSTCMMTIGSMVVVGVLQKVGLLNRIGYWCIVKAGGSFKGIIWGLYFASLIMMLVGFAMTMVLTYAFAYALYRALDLKPSDKESIVIVWTTVLGGILSATFLFCPITVSLLNSSVQTVLPDITIRWYELMLYNSPMFIISLFMVWLGLKWYQITTKGQSIAASKGKAYFEEQYAKLGKMNFDEKKGALILILMAGFLFTQPLHNLDAVFAFLIAIVLFFIPGIDIGDNSCIKSVPWDNVFIIMAFLAVGNVGTALGINNILSNALVPVIAGMGEYWSVLGTFVMGGLVNFILSPFAMLAMLPAPIAQYCIDVGFNPLPHIYAMYQAKDVIFFPYEYPTYLMLFAFGMVKMGDMIKICSVKAIIILIGFIIVFMPFYHFLGWI